MSKEAILDIETKNTIQDGEGWNLKKFRISVIGVYFTQTDTYETYEEHELPKLWKLLEEMDRIIGYNILHFDLPVMNNYYAGDFLQFPTLDLLVEVEKGLGFRVKLDDLAKANLGIGKSGTGLQAIEFYKQGKMQELKDYCLQDVKVTKLLYDKGLAEGRLVFNDRFSGERQIEVDFTQNEAAPSSAINLTMPL